MTVIAFLESKGVVTNLNPISPTICALWMEEYANKKVKEFAKELEKEYVEGDSFEKFSDCFIKK